MVMTDPPYGVEYVENKQDFLKTIHKNTSMDNVKPIAGDGSLGNYKGFTIDWLGVVKDRMADYNTFYVFNGDTKLLEMLQAFEELDIYKSELLIWVKDSIVVGRKDYHPQHELVVYGWYGKHKYYGARDKSVLKYKRPRISKLHPTMKPVEILRNFIYHGTLPGMTVYDPFGGSGSTLIACEQLNRNCLMIELEADYCKIIIKRWEKLTNKKATLLLRK